MSDRAVEVLIRVVVREEPDSDVQAAMLKGALQELTGYPKYEYATVTTRSVVLSG